MVRIRQESGNAHSVLPADSPLRLARAAAVLEMIGPGTPLDGGFYHDMRARGMSRNDVDCAIDDLVNTGKLVLRPCRVNGVVAEMPAEPKAAEPLVVTSPAG